MFSLTLRVTSKPFHSFGPMMKNALILVYTLLHLGTWARNVNLEHKFLLWLLSNLTSSVKYLGAISLKHLNMRIQILYAIHSQTQSQYRSLRWCGILSNILILQITLQAMFCIFATCISDIQPIPSIVNYSSPF